MEEAHRQQVVDEEQLRLLAILWKVSAGITAFYSLFGLIYVGMGAVFAFIPFSESAGEPPPEFFAVFMGLIGLAFLVIGMTIAALKWHVGRLLTERRGTTFIQVIAGLSCLEVPYGTALGVFTFIVLGRPSVRALFETRPTPA